MRSILADMMGTVGNMKKTRRVADESILAGAGNAVELPQQGRRRNGYRGISVIFTIVLAPLSLLSCLTSTQPNSVDGVWASGGDLGLMSEMNQLMVNDSMRYAILL